MATTNQDWLDGNAGTPYPVDEAATAVADDGRRLPPGLVVDLALRWPAALGRYAFLASAAVTPGLVTVTVQAADGPDAASGFVPLAVVAVPRPVDVGRAYALSPQAAGVGGWLTFGPRAAGPAYAGRFSTPAQSRLVPRAARAYASPPVAGLGSATAASPLSGVVALRADPPLQITAEEREVDGVVRLCAVVSLANETREVGGTPTLEKFAGPCAGRPESRTCGDPQPVEFVNGVGPDCDGVLTLRFAGCAAAARVGGCGVALDCGLGLAEACPPPRWPDADGRLPGEYDAPTPDEPAGAAAGSASASDSFLAGALPYLECFTGGTAANFVEAAGVWGFADDDSPAGECAGSASAAEAGDSYATASAASRAVSVWSGFDVSAAYRRVTTELKMLDGGVGARSNGGVVLNYKPHPDHPDRSVYHFAELDYDAQELRISRFTGTDFARLASVAAVGVARDAWYRVTASATTTSSGHTTLTARVESVTDASVDSTVSTTTTGYSPATGLLGLGADRALTRFSYFKVENLEPAGES
jgi:hypothetical protein